MRRCSAVRLLLVASLLAGLAGCQREPGLRIVLITLDTLRFDDFAGGDLAPTRMPLTRRRSRGALFFLNFYSATSTTQPSQATALTGLHPWEHGVTQNGDVLDERFVTVAERLQEAGFETRAVVGSFPVAARFGFAQGFDHFDEPFDREFFGIKRWEGAGIPERAFFTNAETVTRHAIEALDDARGSKQFLWVHYFDPHSPYGDSQGETLASRDVLSRAELGENPRSMARRAHRLYAADLAYLDEWLERLFQRLAADADETHVLVVADHGESFGESGSLGHGWRLTEEQIHVPAILITPRTVRHRPRLDTAGSIDVTRTLLSLAGLEAEGIHGRDLGAGRPARPRTYGMRQTSRGTRPQELRMDGIRHDLEPYWFYAVEPSGRVRRGNARGVQPESGPEARRRGPRVLDLFQKFEAQLQQPAPPEALDPEAAAGLRALGYGE